jgi:hypothetical protein
MLRFDPDVRNPYYECPDDDVCGECGADLPDEAPEGSLAWEGFCSSECEATWAYELARNKAHFARLSERA